MIEFRSRARFTTTRRFLFALAVLLGAIPIEPAVAACGYEAGVQCRGEFEWFTSVVRSGDGLTAVGLLKETPTPGVALLRFTLAGAVRGSPQPIPPPPDLPQSAQMNPRKLIALPDGDVIVLGNVRLNDAQRDRQVAWAARVASNGRVVWNELYRDDPNITIFYSGLHEANGDKVILVGRRSNGGDDTYRCETWSQSLVIAVATGTGAQLARTSFGEQGRTPTNRQAIYDIARGERPGSYAVTGFRSAAHTGPQRGCQDNNFVGTLVETNNRWTLPAQFPFGNFASTLLGIRSFILLERCMTECPNFIRWY
jgi:hypothetical protein